MWFCLFGECRLFWGHIRCLLCAPSDFLGLTSLQNPWLLFWHQLLLLWCLLTGPGAATVASLGRTQCLSLGFLRCLSPVCSRASLLLLRCEKLRLAGSSLVLYSAVQGGRWEFSVWWARSVISGGTEPGDVFSFLPRWSHMTELSIVLDNKW